VDFSYPISDLVGLALRMNKVVVLDHHATAKDNLSAEAFKKFGAIHVDEVDGFVKTVFGDSAPQDVKFDMAKSGAVLAWEYFHPGVAVPEFFLYLQDRDLWQWKMPMSREVSDAIRSYPFNFEVWKSILVEIAYLKTEGVGIRRMTKQIVEQAARNAAFGWFDLHPSHVPQVVLHVKTEAEDGVENQYYTPILNCTAFISETCEKMLELHPEAKFVASYFDSKDGKRIWSLRSRKDFDCAFVSKAFGGGGHAQACGFTQTI
jgi:oligoribonuclease NrnB/cAMP/cGMP phosphodiesterase (DHH superfamily)